MNFQYLNTCGYFQLACHLFEAVLKENTRRVRSLLSVGADADQELCRAGKGPLCRELQITSPRGLARSLRHESILRALDTEVRGDTMLI